MHKKRLIILFYLVITSAFLLYADNDSMNYKVKRRERPFIDISKVPDDAFVKGVINVKFKPNLKEHLEKNPVSKTAKGIVKFGLPSIDNLNRKYKVKKTKLLFSTKSSHTGFTRKHRAWGFHLWHKMELDANEDIKKVISEYKKLPEIEIVEPEYKKRKLLWTPDDPRYEEQWHYDNTGQEGGTPDCDIDLPEAWDITKGNSNVIVAVIDGGIQYDHPDLEANMWSSRGYNFVTDNTTINPEGHGTHVAGTIAANTNNTTGVAGIAGGTGSGDGVRLMSCQVFDGNNAGGFHPAHIYAADNGAAIAQNSWGYIEPRVFEQAVLDAIDYFNANGGGSVLDGGITFFAASNDNSSGQWYPACYSGVTAVAATNKNDERAFYSNYDIWVDISAPGGEFETEPNQPTSILSTYTGSGYEFLQGTSMACPHASGVAALVISYKSGLLSASDVRDILLNSADDHYAQNPDYIGKLGTGRLNAYNALMESEKFLSAANPKNFTASAISPSQIDLAWEKNDANNDVLIAWNSSLTFGTPVSGTSYTVGQPIPGGGTVLYNGGNTSFSHIDLASSTIYYYKAWSVDGSNNFSGGKLSYTATMCDPVSDFPFIEGFESSFMPECWAEEREPGCPHWRFVKGNGLSPPYNKPPNEHGGTKNACLFDQSFASNRNKLITPPLDLSSFSSVNLTFWHAQVEWGLDQDELRIYYKPSATSNWTLLQSYTSEASSWIERTISLPNTTAEYYVAFEGDAQYGYGVCIDDITIDGTIKTYEVTVNSSGGGTTNPSGTQTVSHGNDLLISASPDEGYYFSNWTSTGGLIIEDPASASTKVLNVTFDGTVTANFIQYGSITVIGLDTEADVYIHATNGWQGTKARDGSGPINGLKPGIHILRAHEQGKRTELVSVLVSAGTSIDVSISLRDAIPVIFTDKTAVEDSDGVPIDPNIFNSTVMDDIDRDNDVDLVVAEADGDISYYLYDGGFGSPSTDNITLGASENIVCMRCADLNADGNRELVIGLNTGEIFLFNIGNKTESAFYTAGSDLTGFDIIEDNDDDEPDLLLGYTDGTIKMALSDGSGDWEDAQNLTLTGGSSDIDVGDNATPLAMDLDGDGVKDLVVGNQDGNVQWFKGDGTLEYAERGSVNSGGMPLVASGNTALSMGYNTTMNELPFMIVTDAEGNVYQSHAILLGDVDDDGKVFINDFSAFFEFWELDDNDPGWNASVNFDVTPNGTGDQEIDLSDFTLFNDSWRKEK